MKSIKLLTSFSNSLDDKEFSNFANKIDKVSFSIGKIITAQFEGGIGYWIRNSRCWDNCYRQNRTKSPNKPTQEVWQNCWKEYNASIGDNASGWEKYADKNDKNIVKTASKNVFGNEIEKLIKEGMSVNTAISTIKYAKQNEFFDSVIEQTEVLIRIASDLKCKDEKLSKELIAITQELVKEAGMWSGLMGKGTNYQAAVGIFTQNTGNLLRNLDIAAKDPQLALKNKKKLLQMINNTFANLNRALPSAGFASRGIRDLNNNFIQQMTPIFNSIAQSKTPEQINGAVANATSAVSAFSNKVNNIKLPKAELQDEEPQQELPQVLQPAKELQEATPIQIAEDMVNKGQYDDVIKIILSNPNSDNAFKQWLSFSGLGQNKVTGNQFYAFNLKKNKKFSAAGDKPATTTTPANSNVNTNVAIPEKYVAQIMNFIKQKMGPDFNEWIKKYTQNDSAPAGASSATAKESEKGIDSQFLINLINQAAGVVKSLPEEQRDEVSQEIEMLKEVPDIIKKLQQMISSNNVSMPGFTQINDNSGQVVTGLPEAK